MRTDSSPGCAFWTTDTGILCFTDFSMGKTWNCWQLVQEIYKCSFYDALRIIDQDFGLGLTSKYPERTRKPMEVFISDQSKKKDKRYQIVYKTWTKSDLVYWKEYYIQTKTLRKFKVRNGAYLFLNGYLFRHASEISPMYIYEFEDDSFKGYLPLEKSEKKWVSNASKDILQGYEQLPKNGEILFVTKSLKDVMVLYELGYTAVAVQGETVYPKEELMEELKTRFKTVVVLFDNDGMFFPPKGIAGKGKQATIKFCNKFNFPYFHLVGAKDISDFIKMYGFEAAKKEIEYGMGQLKIDFTD